MASSAFDPTGAVRFDMRAGAATDARGERLVLLPVRALAALESAHPAALALLGTEIGKAIGSKVASRIGGDAAVRAASLEIVVTHLAGELAVAGLGALHLERWGRALVCVLGNAPSSDAFTGAALAAALGAATGRETSVTGLGREGAAARFFVGSAATVARVREAIVKGRPFAEVLSQVQGGAS